MITVYFFLLQRLKMGPKTRKALNTGVGEFLGVGKEMNTTEVPTLRDALREAQLSLIKDQSIISTGKDGRNIDMGKIINILIFSHHVF